jgi:hypothetical protein
MEEMHGAIEPELGLHTMQTGGWSELIDDAIEADGIVLGNRAIDFGAEDPFEIAFRRSGTPGRARIGGCTGQMMTVLWDVRCVQVMRGVIHFMDPVTFEFYQQAVLESSI